MPKILIIGDIHCKKASVTVVGDVLDKCKKLATKVDTTVLLGDINDTKANIRSETIRLLYDKLADWPTPIIAMVGNHDWENAIACDRHSLEFLRHLEHVKIVDEPWYSTYLHAQFCPYYPEDRFFEVAAKFRKTAKLAFLHQDMEGTQYSNGRPVESSITPNIFEKYKKVFIGHIHLPQEFDNIYYVGTPYTESFKESNEKKRVVIYDTKKDKIMEIPLGVRQHVTFEYTISELDEIKTIKRDINDKRKSNHIVRVIINAPEELEPRIKRSLFKDMNIDTLKTKKIATANKAISVTEAMSNVEMMETYLKQLDISSRVLENVLNTNKTILGELGG